MNFLEKLLASLLAGAVFICLGISLLAALNKKEVPTINSTETGVGPIVRLHFASSGRFFCSGTVISNNRVVTAGHCAAAAAGLMGIIKDDIIVKSNTDMIIDSKARALSGDPRTDQGMVEGDFSRALKYSIVTDPTKNIELWKSDKLLSCGYPFGGKLFCIPITGARQYNFGWAGHSYLYPGMSGGPVFDLRSGLVVGINSAVGEENSLFATTLEIFNNLGITP